MLGKHGVEGAEVGEARHAGAAAVSARVRVVAQEWERKHSRNSNLSVIPEASELSVLAPSPSGRQVAAKAKRR